MVLKPPPLKSLWENTVTLHPCSTEIFDSHGLIPTSLIHLQLYFVHRASSFVTTLVHNSPSHRFEHRNFIFETDLCPMPLISHQMFSHADPHFKNCSDFGNFL